jgi:N-glycosylase/DNA lyase
MTWQDVPGLSFEFDPALLSLTFTFSCGQAFRWQKDPAGAWIGVVRGRAWRVRQERSQVTWQTYPVLGDPTAMQSYCRLDVNLAAVYADLVRRDEHIARAIARFPGLRLLAQEPTECLLSYICSTGNAIPRISRSIEKMSSLFGRHIGRLEGKDYYAFPSAAALAAASTTVLAKDCDLDYRAPRLQDVAAVLEAKPSGWLDGLQRLPYDDARAELIQIRGVGQKIADCVCLFSLAKDEAVPVDTHIWQVGQALFLPREQARTLTPARYRQVADLFRLRYGPFAGWAQEYLFYDHLTRGTKRRKQ